MIFENIKKKPEFAKASVKKETQLQKYCNFLVFKNCEYVLVFGHWTMLGLYCGEFDAG